jgi:hypothetical protein
LKSSTYDESSGMPATPEKALCGSVSAKETQAARALVRAFRELNEIRARDGVPWTSSGYPACVSQDYFSAVVDEIDAAVIALTGKGAHCHPLLYDGITG